MRLIVLDLPDMTEPSEAVETHRVKPPVAPIAGVGLPVGDGDLLVKAGRPVYSSAVSMVAFFWNLGKLRNCVVLINLKPKVIILTVVSYSLGAGLKYAESFA